MSREKNNFYKNNLKKLREVNCAGMSRSEFARRLGFKTGQQIITWENGNGRPKINMMIQIAQLLNCQVHDIWTETTEEEKQRIEEYIKIHKTEKNNLTSENRNGIMNINNSLTNITNMLKIYNERGEMTEIDARSTAIPITPEFIMNMTGDITLSTNEAISERIFLMRCNTPALEPLILNKTMLLFDSKYNEFEAHRDFYAIKTPLGKVKVVDARISVSGRFDIAISYKQNDKRDNLLNATYEDVKMMYGGKIDIMGRMCGVIGASPKPDVALE